MHLAVHEQGTLAHVVPLGQRVTAQGATKHIGVTRQGLRQRAKRRQAWYRAPADPGA